MDDHLYITSSLDSRLIGYDDRCERYIFKTPLTGSGITVFDGYDDYLIYGKENNELNLFDFRKLENICTRTVGSGSITQIQCYNRRVLTGGKGKFIASFDCAKGWIGNSILMYKHQAPITCIKFDDSRLVTGSSDGVIYVTDYNPCNYDI